MEPRFVRLISDVLGIRPGDVKFETARADIASWDSLKQMDLVMSLEREYEIELTIGEIVRMTSISEIAAVLGERGISVAN